MTMISAHSRYPRSVTGISAVFLLGAWALASAVDGLEVPTAETATPVPELLLTRSERAMCEECGVVAATRRMARSGGETMAAAVTQYEVTVRMRDGSIRTFIETSSVQWRSGERIILIEDAGRSLQ